MNGFLLAWSPDGEKIDAGTIETLKADLHRRYPDGSAAETNGAAGAIFATLRTVNDVREFPQPHRSSEGWLFAADARLDDRDDLRAKLPDADLPADAADAEYILAAYRRWGRDCVDHLRGDYAFALFDGQDLFIAHDHFAVIPVYYAKIDGSWVVSNDLKAIRAWPGCNDRLNDQFIADFLMFGMNMDTGTTVYSEIRRLKPAHAMTIGRGNVRIRRFYEMPSRQVNRRRSDHDTIAEFSDLLKTAVRDRLRWPKATTHLSGGMDSSTVTVLAVEELGAHNVVAHNQRYQELFHDQEGILAAEIAAGLGVRIRHYNLEEVARTPMPDQQLVDYPEPLNVPHCQAETYSHLDASGHSRLILTGFGGDPLLAFGKLLPGQRAWRRLRQTAHSLKTRRQDLRPTVPNHLREAPFARNFPLEERLCEVLKADYSDQRAGMFDHALWSNIFAWSTPPFQPAPVCLRYPFFDVRLVEFMQTVAPLKWLRRKRLLRQAMSNRLSNSIIERPKTSLPLSVGHAWATDIGVRPWQIQLAESEVVQYFSLVEGKSEQSESSAYRDVVLTASLSHWLARFKKVSEHEQNL